MSDFSDDALQSYPFAEVTLPKNWERVSLGEISANINPGFASGKHNSDGSGVPHLRPMNVDRDGQIDLSVVKSVAESKDVELKSGDILFNNTNSAELVGKTAVVSHRETGFAFSNHMTRLQPESGIASSFVARQLHFLWMSGYMKYRCTNHVNQASISSKTLANTIPFFLPPSAEQIRIVAKLEELLTDLDVGVAELKAAQKKLKQYRQSLLKSAVEGALTAEWRAQHTPTETGAQLLQRILTERRARWEAKQLAKFKDQGKAPPKDWQKKYPEPVPPVTTGLAALPAGWVWASVQQLTEFVTSGSRGWADYYAESGATFIRSQNINKDWLDLSDIAFVTPPAGSEGARTRVQQNDILLTITGANVGKAARVETELKEAYVSQHVALVRVLEPMLAELLHLFLTADAGGRGQLNKEAYGAGKPGLNLQQVAAVSVPLAGPVEIRELLNTVEIQLQAAGEIEAAIKASLKQSTAQRQNILRAAFAGQLVPQDPNDEPASVLLKRIGAERAARDKQPRLRKVRKTKEQKEIAAVVSKLIDVLAESGDWVPAQEAFARCGVVDGSQTDRIEELYAELRELHVVEQRVHVKTVIDEHGRKTGDLLKLIAN